MAVTITALGFKIDAGVVAAAFQLNSAALQDRMRAGEVAALCEKGIGSDAGRFRLTFRDPARVQRLTVDAKGHILARSTFDSYRSAKRERRD